MGLNDRPANRKPHPHAAELRGVKCIEHAQPKGQNHSHEVLVHSVAENRPLVIGKIY
jgi:hypothetical protein